MQLFCPGMRIGLLSMPCKHAVETSAQLLYYTAIAEMHAGAV